MRKAILKEPLLHFLAIGVFLFILYPFLNNNSERTEDYTILLNDSDIDRLVTTYQQARGSRPSAATLKALVEEEIQTEVLYREALRLELDHNDELIRRRLKQKYEFLIRDLNKERQPTEEELRSFYVANQAQYAKQKVLSFRQFYFSPDKRENALADARKALGGPKDQIRGDAFHLPTTFSNKAKEAIRQLFGEAFAERLFQSEEPGWLDPISSGYGQHLVQVLSIDQSKSPSFELVKGRVESDWKAAQLEAFNAELFKNLEAQYEIEFDLRNWANKGIE